MVKCQPFHINALNANGALTVMSVEQHVYAAAVVMSRLEVNKHWREAGFKRV